MNEPNYIVLTVGAQISSRSEIITVLKSSGYEVVPAQSKSELAKVLATDISISIALVDLKDPEVSGYEAMRMLRERTPETQVIVISRKHSTREALEAQQRGAFCYFSDPLDVEEFLFLSAKALVVFELAIRNRDLRTALSGTSEVCFVGDSDEARKVLNQVTRIAPVDTTVLLTGETGTGKTTIARLIHNRSSRANQPFVSLSCASIPRELLEAELFGYKRGAFTGAVSKKIGNIELADKGTLFLDEIGDLPLELQPKLLTFLQDRQLRRLGATKTTSLDVRIIAATNKNLEQMVQEKMFREDLYFRINVVSIKLPSLRARKGDLKALAENFLSRLASRRAEDQCMLSKDALSHMEMYSWPGNIRELENVLERASLFCSRNQITPEDLEISKFPSASKLNSEPYTDETKTLADIEKSAIAMRLHLFAGNKQLAAKSLGISLKTIYNKMRAFGLA